MATHRAKHFLYRLNLNLCEIDSEYPRGQQTSLLKNFSTDFTTMLFVQKTFNEQSKDGRRKIISSANNNQIIGNVQHFNDSSEAKLYKKSRYEKLNDNNKEFYFLSFEEQ